MLVLKSSIFFFVFYLFSFVIVFITLSVSCFPWGYLNIFLEIHFDVSIVFLSVVFLFAHLFEWLLLVLLYYIHICNLVLSPGFNILPCKGNVENLLPLTFSFSYITYYIITYN